MSQPESSPELTPTERQRDMWAAGDFPRVSRETVPGLGRELVEACGVHAGQRVLDVAAGAGNASIPAAETGATVIASDLTPQLLAVGRQLAEERGVALEWVEADAQALPFADAEFDVVMSCMGVMFAPDHQRTADELVRVCRPGGLIGLINGAPGGWLARFFITLAPYLPPPAPGWVPPIFWGVDEYLRGLFGERVTVLENRTHVLEITAFRDQAELLEFYKANFGPVIMAYRNIAGDSERVAALDRDLATWAQEMNADQPAGQTVFSFEYQRTIAQRVG